MAVATPVELVRTFTESVPAGANTPLAPDAGALNVTVVLLSAVPELSFTTTCMGAKAVLTLTD